MEHYKFKQITIFLVIVVIIIATFSGIAYLVIKTFKNQCPVDMHLDPKSNKCRESCRKSQVYDYKNEKCRENCSKSQVYDYKNEKCRENCSKSQVYDYKKEKCHEACGKSQVYDYKNEKCREDCQKDSEFITIGNNSTCEKKCLSDEIRCGKHCHKKNDGSFCDKNDKNNPILCNPSCKNVNNERICCQKGHICNNQQKCEKCNSSNSMLDDFNNCCEKNKVAHDTTNGKNICCDGTISFIKDEKGEKKPYCCNEGLVAVKEEEKVDCKYECGDKFCGNDETCVTATLFDKTKKITGCKKTDVYCDHNELDQKPTKSNVPNEFACYINTQVGLPRYCKVKGFGNIYKAETNLTLGKKCNEGDCIAFMNTTYKGLNADVIDYEQNKKSCRAQYNKQCSSLPDCDDKKEWLKNLRNKNHKIEDYRVCAEVGGICPEGSKCEILTGNPKEPASYKCTDIKNLWSHIPGTTGMETDCKQGLTPTGDEDYYYTRNQCMKKTCEKNGSCCKMGFSYTDGKCYENPLSWDTCEKVRNAGRGITEHRKCCNNTWGWDWIGKDPKIPLPHCKCNSPTDLKWSNAMNGKGGCWTASKNPRGTKYQTFCTKGQNSGDCNFTGNTLPIYEESGNAIFLEKQVKNKDDANSLCIAAGYDGLLKKTDYVNDEIFKNCPSRKQTYWIGDGWWADSDKVPEYYCGTEEKACKKKNKNTWHQAGVSKYGYPVCKRKQLITKPVEC